MLPLPTSLSTQIRPPIISTRLLQMESPRPVPPKRRVMEASAWAKGWKSRSRPAGGMPIPVSRTANSRVTEGIGIGDEGLIRMMGICGVVGSLRSANPQSLIG